MCPETKVNLHSRKIQDDGTQCRPCLVFFPLGGNAVPGARIIPGALGERNKAKVSSTLHGCLDMIHNLAIKHGAVWIKVCLFEAVDENARRREVYADLGVDDTVRGEGNEDVAGIRWVTTRMYPNASEEVASRVCELENEKGCRC